MSGMLTSILPDGERFKIDLAPYFSSDELLLLTNRDLSITIRTAKTWKEVKVKNVRMALRKH